MDARKILTLKGRNKLHWWTPVYIEKTGASIPLLLQPFVEGLLNAPGTVAILILLVLLKAFDEVIRQRNMIVIESTHVFNAT